MSEGKSVEGWIKKKIKGVSKEKELYRHRQQYSDYQRKMEVCEVEKGIGGIRGNERRVDLG